MCNESGGKMIFKCGWDHFWCDPKNFKNYAIKELIKGPFSNSKVVYSIPYITFSQFNSSSVSLSEGIPDCWIECVTHKLRFFGEYLRNGELMHKECADIVPQLRKKYRLYIGQGIPNPWTSYSYIDESEILSPRNLSVENTKNNLCHSSHCKRLKKNFKKEPCFYCKKKYLFECPDKYDTGLNFCSCGNCQVKSKKVIDCNKKCECVELLKSATIKEENTQIRKGNSESGLSSSKNSDIGAQDEDQNLKEENRCTRCCECIRIHKTRDESTASGNSVDEKLNKRNNIRSKKQSDICFCPYIKNFCLRNPRKNNTLKNFSEPTLSSKLIQAELQPIKISRTSQTEDTERKTQFKCNCSNTCMRYSIYPCSTALVKSGCSAIHSISGLCFPLGCPQRPAFVCPCFFSNNFLHKNLKKTENNAKKERKKRKQHKEKETDDELDVAFKINQNASKRDEKYNLKEQKLSRINRDDLKRNQCINQFPEYAKSFDPSKYLTDDKFRRYLQEEKISSSVLNKIGHHSSHSSPRLMNFCRRDTSFYNFSPEKFELEKYRAYSNYKPRCSESSFAKSKMNLRENFCNYNARKFNCSDQATMTGTPRTNFIMEDKFSKETVESDKSRTYDLARKRVFSTKAIRKRKRLLVSRKKGKKLAAGEKVCFLECQASDKLQKGQAVISNQVQVNKTASVYRNFKTPFSPLDILNLRENLKFGKTAFCTGHITDNMGKKVDKKMSVKNLSKSAGNDTFENTLKNTLPSELQLDGVLEKISCNSGSSWSSIALKNIVDDLLLEKNKN